MNLDEYHIQYEKNRLWEKTTWLGVPCWKLPFDAWMIQELICKVRPDFLIETGTGLGGSADFYGSIMELIGNGIVITIDINDKLDNENSLPVDLWGRLLKRIKFIREDSIKAHIEILAFLQDFRDSSVMVILDSDHRKEHVLKEMELYGQLVSKDSYMIVEDTHINGHPVPWNYGDGPYEAVQEFLKTHDEFMIDKSCEKYGITFNPSGYLKRIK